MPTRKAEATWRGDLKNGDGTLQSASGGVKGAYSFASRFEKGGGTNPEELLAAAHAGCYAMALSHMLSEEGYKPVRVTTEAAVTIENIDGDFEITRILLTTKAEVPEIDEEEFQEIAEDAKEGCPVSMALGSVDIDLKATLI